MPTPRWGKGVEMSRGTSGLFLPAVLLAFLLSPPAAKANTIVFNDLSETPTVSGVEPSPFTCASPGHPEECRFHISGPAGSIVVSPFGTITISDPGGITISDQIISFVPVAAVASISTVTLAPTVTLEFLSDPNDIASALCTSVTGGCKLTETGEVQTAGTITWLGGGDCPPDCTTVRTDTVEFVSDTDAVPEPASWLLVLTGLPLVGLRRLRRPPVGS
jgi:hypothetical protein